MGSGEGIKADAYVTATGVKPNVEFLEGSGVDFDWGVRTDDHLLTNVPDVYAAGDVAETFDRMTGERYVHAIFPNAAMQPFSSHSRPTATATARPLPAVPAEGLPQGPLRAG